MALKLKKLTGLVTLQDKGRLSAQHLGFSTAGACDENAFLSANQDLQNAENIAALEFFILGKTVIEFTQAAIIILTGADASAHVNDKAVSHWQPLLIKAGDILKLQRPIQGKVTYLSILGGYKLPLWLGSSSQSINEEHINQTLPLLKEGDLIHFAQDAKLEELIKQFAALNNNKKTNLNFPLSDWRRFYDWQNKSNTPHLTIRFIPSPLFFALPLRQQNNFLQQTFTINPQSNRMGYRLIGTESLILNADLTQQKSGKLSKPVTLGTIQIPNDGQPIVLMKDRQTIGGYPVIGSVIQLDLFRLSQCHSETRISFAMTHLNFAQTQLKNFYQRFLPKT